MDEAEKWKALFIEAVEEFEDAMTAVDPYFVKKYGYKETLARFYEELANG